MDIFGNLNNLNSLRAGGTVPFNPKFIPGLALWDSSTQRSTLLQDAAVQFVAADKSWLSITNAAQTGLNPLTGDFSVVNSYKPTDFSTYYSLVSKGSTSDNTAGYNVIVDPNGKIRLYFGDGSGSNLRMTSTTALNAGAYNNIVVTFSRAGLATVYINGVADATTLNISSQQGSIGNTYDFTLGYYVNGVYYCNGAIDSVGYYSRALTAAEASTLNNSGKGLVYANLTGTLLTGLVSWWNLNEPTGIRNDSTATGNNLSQSFANIIQPAVYGSELVLNPGFETASWTNWQTFTDDGALSQDTVNPHAGTYDAKITAGASVDTNIYQSITVLASTNYRLSFWTHGDGLNAGRYEIFDNNHANDILALTSTSITNSSWTLKTYDFATPAGCTSIQITLECPATNGGIAYFDDISLKQITTAAINNGGFENWTVPTPTELITNGYFTSNTSGWTAGGAGAIASVAGGEVGNALQITNSGTEYNYAYQAITTTVGQAYRFRFWHINGTTTGSVAIGTTSSGTQIYNGSALNDVSGTARTIDFTATATTTYIRLLNGTNTTALTTLFDGVEVYAIPMTATNWSNSTVANAGVYREDTTTYNGTNAVRLDTDSAGDTAGVYSTNTNVGKLYYLTFYAKASSGTPNIIIDSSGGSFLHYHALTTSYSQVSDYFRADKTNFRIKAGADSSTSFYVDSVTLTAAEILSAPGIAQGQSQDVNFSAQLNGSSNFFYTGTSFDPGTGDFSVGGSFYADSLSGTSTLFSSGTAGSGNQYLEVYISSAGQVQFQFNDGSGTAITGNLSPSGSILVGNWYDIIVNFTRAGNAQLILNNVAQTGVAISTKTGSINAGNFYLGRYAASATNYFTGRLDNFFYANRTLTTAEATFMHNNGQWRQWAELGVAGTAGSALTNTVIAGFWEFDYTGANIGVDASGSNVGANLVLNPGFEAGGGYLTSWTNDTGGTISDETTLKHAGANAVKGTSANSSIYATIHQAITITDSRWYTLTFWTRGDGSAQGAYNIYDTVHSASLASGYTGITGTTYTQITKTFYAPYGCTSLTIYAGNGIMGQSILPTTGSCYFDDFSLVQLSNSLSVSGTITQAQGINYNVGTVSYWGDLSGQGNNKTQTTIANRPYYVSSFINGLPAVVGNGSTTSLAIPTLTATGGFYFGVRFAQNGTASNSTIIASSNGQNFITLTNDTTVSIKIANGTTLNFTVSGMGTALHTLEVLRDASNAITVYLDGAASASNPQTGTGTLTLNTLFSDSTHFGNLGITKKGDVFYTAVISTSQRLQLEKYLSN